MRMPSARAQLAFSRACEEHPEEGQPNRRAHVLSRRTHRRDARNWDSVVKAFAALPRRAPKALQPAARPCAALHARCSASYCGTRRAGSALVPRAHSIEPRQYRPRSPTLRVNVHSRAKLVQLLFLPGVSCVHRGWRTHERTYARGPAPTHERTAAAVSSKKRPVLEAANARHHITGSNPSCTRRLSCFARYICRSTRRGLSETRLFVGLGDRGAPRHSSGRIEPDIRRRARVCVPRWGHFTFSILAACLVLRRRVRLRPALPTVAGAFSNSRGADAGQHSHHRGASAQPLARHQSGSAVWNA